MAVFLVNAQLPVTNISVILQKRWHRISEMYMEFWVLSVYAGYTIIHHVLFPIVARAYGADVPHPVQATQTFHHSLPRRK